MTTIQATQDEIGKIWPTVQGGDVLELIGRFQDIRTLSKRTFDKRITIDGSKAVIAGWYLSLLGGVDWHDLTIEQGVVRADGLRIDHPADMSFTNVKQASTTNVGNGLWLNNGSNLDVAGLVSKGFKNSLVFGQSHRLSVRQFDFSGFGSDGLDLANCQDAWVRDGKIHDPYKTTKDHPDGIQMWSSAGSARTARVLIEHIDINGHMQGINLFDHPTSGQLGGEDVTVRHCQIAIDYVWGVCLQNVDRPCVEDVHVTTLDGDVSQATISLSWDDGQKHDFQRFGNTVAAYGRHAAVSDPVRTTYPKWA